MLLTLGASLALLAGLEAALRAAGLGDLPPGQASRLPYQQVEPPLLSPGQRPDGARALITNDARVPWQALLDPKPAGGLRVVAVGGSATAGLGFSPNVSFPRELERMLRAAEPGRPIEVLNLGIVALSSQQVRWIVADACRNLRPDAVLVYSGNNEFLEIHAARFGELRGGRSGLAAALGALRDTNLFRLVGGGRGPASARDASIHDMSRAQRRVSETEMMREVRLTPGEHAGVVAAYTDNLRAMVSSGREHDVPVVLMTVASNWEWQGRDDLPDGWCAELLTEAGVEPGPDPDAAALAVVEQRLTAAGPHEQHGWMYRRGLLLGRLGRWDEARASLRAACNADPRQRRATDELAARVRDVARDLGAPLVDTVLRLGEQSPHGVLGDELFYDYVHFTPRGCVLTAAAVFDELEALGLARAPPLFDAAQHVAGRVAYWEALEEDPLAIGEWIGLGDPARVHDRNLWKHQDHVDALDACLARNPDDVDALVRRGNAWFFARDGFDDAVGAYERALTLRPDLLVAAANLKILRSTRTP